MEKEATPMELLKQEVPQLKALMQLNALPGTDVETMALQELEYLRTIAMSNSAIMQCMPQTVLIAVKTVIKQNLSMDPSAGLVYVKTRNVNMKKPDGTANWKKALEIIPSANGLISINRQCGRLLDIKNPVVKKNDQGKVVEVSVEILLPSIPSPRWETRTFDESDFWRWQRASHKENGRNKNDADADKLNYANDNYTNFKGGIDPEFARAKAIRHGLKKLGANQNEGRMNKIDITDFNKVQIDTDADAAVAEDATTYTPIVEETTDTKTETAVQPNKNFQAEVDNPAGDL